MHMLSQKNLSDNSNSDNEDIAVMVNQNSKSLAQLQDGLKLCKNDKGFFHPQLAFNCLNEIQKMEDPKAY